VGERGGEKIKSEKELREIYKKLKNAYEKWEKTEKMNNFYFCLDCKKGVPPAHIECLDHYVIGENPYLDESAFTVLEFLKWILEG